MPRGWTSAARNLDERRPSLSNTRENGRSPCPTRPTVGARGSSTCGSGGAPRPSSRAIGGWSLWYARNPPDVSSSARMTKIVERIGGNHPWLCHWSFVRCHLSLVTCHLSLVTCNRPCLGRPCAINSPWFKSRPPDCFRQRRLGVSALPVTSDE